MEEEDFDLIGKVAAPTDDEEEDTVDATTEEEVEDATEKEDTEESVEEEKPTSDDDYEEAKPSGDKAKALSQERARRKAAEKELKELKAQLEAKEVAKENEEEIAKEREAYKKKMLEGDLVDEDVADKLLDVFGEDLIKTKIANQKRTEAESFEEAISELKKDELFMDAAAYKPQIIELMKKGLTAKQAYMASISDSKFSQMKKDIQVETEQRLLNSQEKASKVDVGVPEAKSEVKRGNYTKREQEIAKETGLPVSEVHKRSTMFSIEDIENL